MSRAGRKRGVESLPEDTARVAAFDAMLRKHKSEVLDFTRAHHERYARRKITTLRGIGWPLRPLFLQARQVDFLATALHRCFQALQRKLVAKGDSPAYLARKLPIDRRVYECLDFRAGVASEGFLSIIRPDGFLFPDRYVMTEINFGNGTIVSNAYSEVVFDYFKRSPVFRELGWDVDQGIRRSFLGYVEMIKRYAGAGRGRPFVALLAHSFEHQVILDYPPRVIQQIYFAQRQLAAAGVDTRIVHEDEVFVDKRGRARVRGERRSVDLVLQITIGTSFMDEPERLAPGGDLSVLRGARVGDAPLLKPVAAVCMDKGTIPFFSELPIWPVSNGDGFRVELVPTSFPTPAQAASLRLSKDRWVLKKAFDGKDTVVGVSAPGRAWNRTVEKAVSGKGYVLQEYASMPRTTIPVAIDGKHIEWVPVRVELSPFIFDGRFRGAIARYAPDAEGLILSPPPEGMGLTTVFAA